MKVKTVDNIKDGNKAARRENMYGGGKMKNRYGMKHGGKPMKGDMPKAKPC
jgi:hypothetical protein